MKKRLLLAATVLFAVSAMAQKNKAYFREVSGTHNVNVLNNDKKEDAPKPRKVFKTDYTGIDVPTSAEQFKKEWYNEPLSQGNTGTCWSFSTTSYLETEVYRLTKQKIKLSEMYTVYWEYVEKARYFVKTRGASFFGEGSEADAVTRIWKKYGVVPAEAYRGIADTAKKMHDHSKMYEEMLAYLNSVKQSNAWNEEAVIATIKSILNVYMGEPPTKVKVNANKELSPLEYLKNVLKLNLDDYVCFMSLMESPYYEQCEYKVPDNWWHSDTYYNIPLDEYMAIAKKAIRSGYTIILGGDVSEPGLESNNQCAIVPTFDIPSEYIDESARQMRFTNSTTGDDHGIHVVGYLEKNGKDWYLIKDSGSGSRRNFKDKNNIGYYYFHEDYLKLKILDFMVHKDVAKEVLDKFKKK